MRSDGGVAKKRRAGATSSVSERLGGGFKYCFHPYLGRRSNLTNVFQMGWNHQLEGFSKQIYFCLWFYGGQHKGSSFSKVARGDVSRLEKLIWDEMNESPSLTLQKRIMIFLVFQNYQNTLGLEMFRTPFQAVLQEVWKGILWHRSSRLVWLED